MQTVQAPIEKTELQYQAMVLLCGVVKFNDTWLSSQSLLVKQMLEIWTSDAFLLRHLKVVSIVSIVSFCDWL